MLGTSPTFRLGVYRLSAAESGLVRALLKLMSGDDDSELRWSFADQPPYDAVVADGAMHREASQFQAGNVRRVLLLADTQTRADAGPDMLARPLHAEPFRAWLLRTQADVAQAYARLTSTAAPTDMGRSSGLHEEQFKLLRWPPAALLQRDQKRVRMATLLSRRAVTLSELMSVSQESEDQCRSFLRALRSFGLVETLHQAVTPPSLSPDPGPVHLGQLPPLERGGRHGLVQSIRRRLGL